MSWNLQNCCSAYKIGGKREISLSHAVKVLNSTLGKLGTYLPIQLERISLFGSHDLSKADAKRNCFDHSGNRK